LKAFAAERRRAKKIANELRNWVAKEIGRSPSRRTSASARTAQARSGKIMRRLLAFDREGEAITQGQPARWKILRILDQLAQTN